MNEGQDKAGASIVTSGEARNRLSRLETALDDIALAVIVKIVMSLIAARGCGRITGFCAGRADCFDQSAAVIARISNDVGRLETSISHCEKSHTGRKHGIINYTRREVLPTRLKERRQT